MPDADVQNGTTPSESAPAPAPATEAAAAPKPAPTEAISGDVGDAGKAAIQKERDARKELERKLTEAQQLKDSLAAKVQEFEDAKKSETEKLNDQLTRLQKQLADKDAEITKAQQTSLRAAVAAEKGVPMGSLSGITHEELLASADELIAWRDANAPKRTPKPPAPSGGLKSGASASGDRPGDPKERAHAALRAHLGG